MQDLVPRDLIIYIRPYFSLIHSSSSNDQFAERLNRSLLLPWRPFPAHRERSCPNGSATAEKDYLLKAMTPGEDLKTETPCDTSLRFLHPATFPNISHGELILYMHLSLLMSLSKVVPHVGMYRHTPDARFDLSGSEVAVEGNVPTVRMSTLARSCGR